MKQYVFTFLVVIVALFAWERFIRPMLSNKQPTSLPMGNKPASSADTLDMQIEAMLAENGSL